MLTIKIRYKGEEFIHENIELISIHTAILEFKERNDFYAVELNLINEVIHNNETIWKYNPVKSVLKKFIK